MANIIAQVHAELPQTQLYKNTVNRHSTAKSLLDSSAP